MRSTVTVAFLVLLAGTAAAQPGITAPSSAVSQPTVAPFTENGDTTPSSAASQPTVAPGTEQREATPSSVVSVAPGTARGEATEGSVVSQPTASSAERSEATALWLSLGGTAASWALVAVGTEMNPTRNSDRIRALGTVGTLVAPNFGHLYAHSYFTRGLALRLAGLSTLFAGAFAHEFACYEGCRGVSVPSVLYAVSAALYLGGTVDDLATAPGKARRYNHTLHDVAVVPVLGRDGSSLALTGRF